MTAISTILSPNVERWVHQYFGIDTIEEAQKLTDEQLLSIPNMGKIKVHKIRNYKKPSSCPVSIKSMPAIQCPENITAMDLNYKRALKPLLEKAYNAGAARARYEENEHGHGRPFSPEFETWFEML